MSGDKKDIVGSFVGFVDKYAGELETVTSILETLVNKVPILKDEKVGIHEALDTLKSNVDSLNKFVKKDAENIPTVIIRQSDIDAAIERYMANKDQQNKMHEALAHDPNAGDK